jgi:site-specific recombinase XerD
MSTELVDPMASVRTYLEAGQSSNTKRAYKSDWAHFSAWCDTVNLNSMPAAPIDVARYLAQLADSGLTASTIERRVAAIRSIHKAAGLEPPTNAEGVKLLMAGIRRQVGTRQVRKAPATSEVLTLSLNGLSEGLVGLRDRALLLVGFAAALRRSELVALHISDVLVRPKGMILHIGRSKTDQEGVGAHIPIPRGGKLQPVAALLAWLEAAGITEGPIFREIDRHGRVGTAALSDRSVARIVKKVLGAAGLNASDFSGHSLRAGFVTSSLDRKVDALKIMGITRHAKVDTLKIYDRRESGFDDHAGEDFL